MEYCNILYCYNGILQYIVLLQWNIAIYCIVIMEYCNILYCCNGICNIFIAEYQYNQYNNNIIVPSAGSKHMYEVYMYIAKKFCHELRSDYLTFLS